MMDKSSNPLEFLTEHALRISALVLASLWRGREYPQILRALRRATAVRRRVVIAGVLGSLFGLAIVAASFGPWGLGAYFILIAFLAR